MQQKKKKIGEKPTQEELKQAFGTNDMKQVSFKQNNKKQNKKKTHKYPKNKNLQTIVLNGELQLTANDRKLLVENKRKQIVNLINKEYINPTTLKPYGIVQIDSALTSIKAKIEIEKRAEDQVKTILKTLILSLPLKKVEEMEGTLKIPLKFVGQVQSFIHKHCKVISENFESENCVFNLQISSSEYDNFILNLTKSTNGDFQFDVPQLSNINSDNNNNNNNNEKKGGKKGKQNPNQGKQKKK